MHAWHCENSTVRTCLCDQKCNATFGRARFDRAATWLMSSGCSGHYHSDARIRKGRLPPCSALAGERYRLDPKFIRSQQTPDTLGFGRRQDFGGLGPIFLSKP